MFFCHMLHYTFPFTYADRSYTINPINYIHYIIILHKMYLCYIKWNQCIKEFSSAHITLSLILRIIITCKQIRGVCLVQLLWSYFHKDPPTPSIYAHIFYPRLTVFMHVYFRLGWQFFIEDLGHSTPCFVIVLVCYIRFLSRDVNLIL